MNTEESWSEFKPYIASSTMKKYIASPWAGIAQVNINGENRCIYSNVQQQDGSLIREYFKFLI